MRNIAASNPLHTQVLLESLLESPLLVTDLSSACVFDRRLIFSPSTEWSEFDLNYSQKLGHLYEDALGYLLEKSKQVELIASSIQIFDENKITLGELDYLLKIGERLIHLEIAVKFYIVHHHQGKVYFPGPDPRDNWHNKLARLESHQLKMAHSSAGRQLLSDKYGIDNIESQQLIYGKLFDHIDATPQQCVLPSSVADDVQRFKWMYLSEFEKMQTESIVVIPKHLWPIALKQYSAELLETLAVYTKNDLIAEVVEYERCVMLWADHLNMPVFVVPNKWPQY